MGISDWIKEWAIPLSAGAMFLLAAAAFWNIIWDIKRSQPNIKIAVKNAYRLFEDDTPTQHFISVDVINGGQQRIKIRNFGFVHSDRKTGILDPTEFSLPKYVEPKDSIRLDYNI